MPSPCLGAHMSISGGPANALRRGHSIGCDAIQMFTRNANRWDAKDLSPEDIAAFCQARSETGIAAVVAHSSYLINLGSPDEPLWNKSVRALVRELERCAQLGIDAYVLHPGAHMGAGEEAGLARILAGLDAACTATADSSVVILLENTAGAGTLLGHTLEQLAWLADHMGDQARVGICLDTAHAFAAGYDLRTVEGYEGIWQAFDHHIGLRRLRALHLNDSKGELGSRLDRHENIGEGKLGLEPFRLLVNDLRLRGVPMLLETPKSADLHEDIENLACLRSLITTP
ncbi:MAG: deoxyribonuclease IV [Anaerolineae bacterium]